MTAFMFALLPLAVIAALTGTAALFAARGQLRQLSALREELAAHRAEIAAAVSASAAASAQVPAARTAPDLAEIRDAVAAALAEERERELAEARAFWAAQDSRDAAESATLDVYLDGFGDDGPEYGAAVYPYPPHPADLAAPEGEHRHPSDPGFVPSPVIADPETTLRRLAELADSGTPLADVRPGPLGTLDLYVFADGTTLCLTPGQRDPADQLAGALREGHAPVLRGSSGISGAYALTFAYGEENVFVLADRVVASF